MTLSRMAISRMDDTKSPWSGPWDTPFGSGIHPKASLENDVQDIVMVGIDVGWETCVHLSHNPISWDVYIGLHYGIVLLTL